MKGSRDEKRRVPASSMGSGMQGKERGRARHEKIGTNEYLSASKMVVKTCIRSKLNSYKSVKRKLLLQKRYMWEKERN